MKKFYKYIQQGFVAIMIAGASAGVVLAAPSFDITTLVSGFIRYTGNFHEPTANCSPSSSSEDYCYGYGWSGLNQEWGYGYGYKSKDFPVQEIPGKADFGFEGDDGSAIINSVSVTQTTAAIDYATSYLAKVRVVYGDTYPLTQFNFIDSQVEEDFNSGERTWDITGLICGTEYYYAVIPQDAGGNYWPVADSFTTDSCDSNGHERERVVGVMGKSNTSNSSGANHNPRGLVLPPITLSPGSFGNDVKNLQILLNFFGTFLASDGAGAPYQETETFGQKTFNALKKFQSTFGLNKVDGIYGQETYNTMKSFLE